MKNERTSSTAPLLIGMAAGAALLFSPERRARRCSAGCRRRHGHQHEPAPDAPHRPQDRQGCRARREPAGQDGGRLRGAQDGGLTPPHRAERPGQRVLPCPGLLLRQKKPHWGFRCFANANFFLRNQRSTCPQIGRFGCHPCIYSRWFLYRRCIFLSVHSRICPSMDSSRWLSLE